MGSNPAWYFFWPVAVMVASVRPWNEFSAAMMCGFGVPCCAQYRRASLMADSLAVAPQFAKNQRAANECVASSSASRTCGSM